MKLKDCTYGRLVEDKDRRRIGMIVGITNNAHRGHIIEREDPSNAIPMVRWSCGEECGIHHANIELLK